MHMEYVWVSVSCPVISLYIDRKRLVLQFSKTKTFENVRMMMWDGYAAR